MNDVKVSKLLSLLTGDKKIAHIANVIDKISIKESEQIRPIVPCRQWVNDQYYSGKECVDKLYPRTVWVNYY